MKHRQWLLCYDIADPRRLARVHRRIVQSALPLQQSVYLFHGSTRELDELLAALAKLIRADADDIRAYPVPRHATIQATGHSLADEAIYLIGPEVTGFTGIAAK